MFAELENPAHDAELLIFAIFLNGDKGEKEQLFIFAVHPFAVEELEDMGTLLIAGFFPAGENVQKVPLVIAVVELLFAEKEAVADILFAA